MAETKKFYWIKLQKDFFKQHSIKVIEAMPNGKDYILFYLKLLVESVSHNGNLRFSDTIPYNAEMLAAITNTNIDVVRSATKVFTELKMMEVLDDQTIYMTELTKMVGCETEWAKEKRMQRSQNNPKLEDNVRTMSGQKKTMSDKSIEIRDKSIDIKKRVEKNPAKPFFSPPSIEEVKAYCSERKNGIDAERFIDFYASKGWLIGKSKMKDWKAAIRTWERRDKSNAPKQSNFPDYSNDVPDFLGR